MAQQSLLSDYTFQFGPLQLDESLITCIGITALLASVSAMLTSRMAIHPPLSQVVLEGVVESIEHAIGSVQADSIKRLTPLIGTLWIFLVVANLIGLVPGLDSPTRDLSVTSALAMIVFFAVHWFGIRSHGLRGYLRHYLAPTPLLLPFHIISELTRTLALSVRLFGNMMSLEIAALLILLVAGFLAPIPLLMLHIIEALVQAYIFGMLALIYIASALQSHQLHEQKNLGEEHE